MPSADRGSEAEPVDAHADAVQLRRAYRRFVQAEHPDHGGDTERFRTGVAAYRRALAAAEGRTARPRLSTTGRPTGIVVAHRRRSRLAPLVERTLGRWRRPARPPSRQPRVR